MKKIFSILTAGALFVSTMSPVFAADGFTPSVEQKEAPVIVETTDKSGISVGAIIVGVEEIEEDWKEVSSVPVEAITVTAISKIDEAPAAVKEEVTAAYNSISEAPSLVEAVPQLVEAVKEQVKVMQEAAAAAALPASTVKDVKAEDLVVRDLVHIQISEEYMSELRDSNALKLSFDLKLDEDAFLIVMVFVDGEWVILPPENVKILPTGEAVVALEQLGTIAFIVEKGE